MSIEQRAYITDEVIAWANALDTALRTAVNNQPSEARGAGILAERVDATSFFERIPHPSKAWMLYFVPAAYGEVMPDSEMAPADFLLAWGLQTDGTASPVSETTSAWDRVVSWVKSVFTKGV